MRLFARLLSEYDAVVERARTPQGESQGARRCDGAAAVASFCEILRRFAEGGQKEPHVAPSGGDSAMPPPPPPQARASEMR